MVALPVGTVTHSVHVRSGMQTRAPRSSGGGCVWVTVMRLMAEEPLNPEPPAADAQGSPVGHPGTRSPEAHAPAGVDGVAGLVARISEHKIVQWVLAYVGAAITIAHGEELLAHAFEWNESIARGLMALLVAGFPVVLGLAWFHGHKGLTRVSKSELMVGSILLLISASLLVTLVRPPTHASQASGPAERRGSGALPASSSPAAAAASASPSVARTASLKPRIAVLPFENLSPDPNNAFFTEGVHEEILTELANHAPGLEVISSTTMATYRGKPVTVQTLAHDLDCAYVLEGSVRREGSEVRLTVQLIDARNDSHVWASDYDRRLVSAMALEREVAAAVTSQLSLKFAGGMREEGLATNPVAYDLYLKARTAESGAPGTGSQTALNEALALLDQAIQKDPSFARAYLERMSLRVQLFLYNYAGPGEVLPQAEADLAAAQRIAPSDPTVTAFAGVMAYATLDYARALQLFETAETEGLADPELLNWKNNLLFAMGRYPEAAALSGRLADLDPKNQSAQRWWVYLLMELHEYQEALRIVDALAAREPADWQDERAMVLGYAGGNFGPRHAEFAALPPWRTAQDVQSHFEMASIELPLQHRFQDFRQLIDRSPIQEWRCVYHTWPLYRVGNLPVADDRGWMDLILGDRTQARLDGQRIDAFLKRTPETKWNRWFRTMLRADAQLFEGDADAANTSAGVAVALTRATPDVSDQMDAYVWSTMILSWGVHKDEAVKRLTELSTSVPGLWPGEIPADPKFSVPLAEHAGYRELTARLAEQMRALGLK